MFLIEILLACLFIAGLVNLVLFIVREQESMKRSGNIVFLRITMPKKDSDHDEKKDTVKDFKEQISIMEQLFASLKSTYSGKILKKILGQDVLSLEYIASEGQIFFYIVCPKHYKKLIEKQINGFYTDAIIEETQKPNILAWKKYHEWTYLHTAKESFYPIKTYQKLESDPINNLVNAFSKIEENEAAALQIMVKPIDDDWQGKCAKESCDIMQWKKSWFSLNPLKIFLWVFGAFFDWDDESPKTPDNNTSALSQERAKTVDEKWDKTWYEVIIRVVVSGDSRHSIHSELVNIVSSFTQFSYPDFNKFTNSHRHNSKRLLRNFSYRFYKKSFFSKKMILNTEELASIFHFPHIKYNKSEEIKWQNFKIVKAPSNLPKEWLLLGHNIHRGVKKEIRIKNEDRMRHFYVIGQTGTWKSSIFQSMIRQDFVNGNGVGVIDPHGDLVKDVLSHVPRERADDFILFDPSDLARPMWLNLLEFHNEDEKELVVMDALNIMIKLFWNEIFGPRLQDYFRNGVMALMDYPQWWALTDIIRIFTDQEFQKDRVRNVKNPVVKAWWESTYASMGDREKWEIIPYFAAKFWQFITNKMMRNIIGQHQSSFDILDVMQNRKILLVNLSKWSLWDLNSKLLWMILVSKLQMAAMRRDKIAKEDRSDFFLYIDEFQNYVTDSIESILSEARKYRLSLNIAHQYLGQLEQSDALTKSSLNLKQAIFWNVWSVMSYKIGPEDGEFMSKYFAPTFSDQDLVNMDKFKWVMKVAVDNQPSIPFSLIPENPYLDLWDAQIAKALIELSRLKYGRDEAFVSKEIEYRIWI